jgi:hypothetical protein
MVLSKAKKIDTVHNNIKCGILYTSMLGVIMLRIAIIAYTGCRYAEYHYADGRGTSS